MDDSMIRQADAIFARAFALGETERAVYLEGACGADEELRDEVAFLIDMASAIKEFSPSVVGSLDPDSQFPSNPTADPWTTASRDLLDRLAQHTPPKTKHRVVQKIGRGGMGAVYKVIDTNLRRTLAMKVMDRAGGSGKTVRGSDPRTIGRFLQEAQVTGQLHHPGIIPVHDLGLNSDGELFFTMRLVKGHTFAEVIRWVWERREGWNQARALGVLLDVLDAMAYAHSRRVIHRDLKPSNVMVGKFGETYVLDWGVARVLGLPDPRDLRLQDSTHTVIRNDVKDSADPDSPLLTMDGLVVGTPAFMPPEQALGRIEEVDARSDVYSVGAMLYHLLTGQMPYVPPGARLSSRTILAQVIQGPPRPVTELNRKVPAELAAICERAMARDQDRRYPDTEAMAHDLRAFLERRVVKAYRTGAVVEFQKWVVRNKGMAAALLFAVLTILTAALVFARNNAVLQVRNQELDDLVEVFGEVLTSPNPYAGGDRDITIVDLLDQKLDAALEKLNASPHLKARFLQIAGNTYLRARGQASKAEALFSEAYRIQKQQLGEGQRETLLSRRDVAMAQLGQGRYREAEGILREVTEAFRRTLGPDDFQTLDAQTWLALSIQNQGRAGVAPAMLREVVAARIRLLGPDDPETLTSMSHLGRVLNSEGEYEEAGSILREVLASRRRTADPEDPDVLDAENSLAASLSLQSKNEEAEEIYRRVQKIRSRVLGPEHPSTLTSKNNLATVLVKQSKFQEAELIFRQVRSIRLRTIGAQHPDTLATSYNLTRMLVLRGRYDEAEEILREVVDASSRSLDPDHPYVLVAKYDLGRILSSQLQFDKAATLLRDVWWRRQHALGPENALTQEAAAELQRALTILEKQLVETWMELQDREGEDHRDTVLAKCNYAAVLLSLDRVDEAEPLCWEVLDHAESLDPRDPLVARAWIRHGACLVRREDYPAAEEALQKGFRLLQKTAEPAGEDRDEAIHALVDLYRRWNKPDLEKEWRARG